MTSRGSIARGPNSAMLARTTGTPSGQASAVRSTASHTAATRAAAESVPLPPVRVGVLAAVGTHGVRPNRPAVRSRHRSAGSPAR